MERQNILNISGGKDSAALYLHALEQQIPFRAVFADTGNEHELTHDFILSLPRRTGGPPVEWVRGDFSQQIVNKQKFIQQDIKIDGWKLKDKSKAIAGLRTTEIPFLDLCLWKGCFPTTHRRFCSEQLKHLVIYSQVLEPLLDQGFEVFSWQGIRAEESRKRATLPLIDKDPKGGELYNYRPLLYWSIHQVFEIHKRHNIEPNPLYKNGMTRVGCMPCIHSTKNEIRNIAARFPEHIQKIARWEQAVSQVSKLSNATFFPVDKTPGKHQNDKTIPIPDINRVVAWSKTSRGGRQYLLFPAPENGCSSQYGLCE
ncbi:MAG: phosphoadenosine phosphosulfate reductase family protein [Desulfobulbaceae bacterium]|nr:phosphoadenosine phosphosulfate reductase family protein [Desulfobulbaceae bacterium]